MYQSVIKIILLGYLLMNATSIFAGKYIEVSNSDNALPDIGWSGSTDDQPIPEPTPATDFDNQPETAFSFRRSNTLFSRIPQVHTGYTTIGFLLFI